MNEHLVRSLDLAIDNRDRKATYRIIRKIMAGASRPIDPVRARDVAHHYAREIHGWDMEAEHAV